MNRRCWAVAGKGWVVTAQVGFTACGGAGGDGQRPSVMGMWQGVDTFWLAQPIRVRVYYHQSRIPHRSHQRCQPPPPCCSVIAAQCEGGLLHRCCLPLLGRLLLIVLVVVLIMTNWLAVPMSQPANQMT
jgi:hypothetical protein